MTSSADPTTPSISPAICRPPPTIPSWTDHFRQTLERYDEALLRRVAARLVRPRGQWPVEELIERCVATLANAPVIDRRCQSLDVTGRRVLGLIGHSRQPRWYVGNLVEMLAALGHQDGLAPVMDLLEAGLLMPDLPDLPVWPTAGGRGRVFDAPAGASEDSSPGHMPAIQSFEAWLAQTLPPRLTVVAHPQVTARLLGEDLGLPECPGAERLAGTASRGRGQGTRHAEVSVREADGLEWLLRMSVVWQLAAASPPRRTQQGDFFKRDLDRLRGDPVLGTAASESLAEIPDPGLLAVALAVQEGLVEDKDGELGAAGFPAAWNEGWPATLASLWAALPRLESWNMEQGWSPGMRIGNPYPSAYLLALLLVSRLEENHWARPAAVADWVIAHHPYWAGNREGKGALGPVAALTTFLLGFAYQLRLVQALKDTSGEWLVRLSSWGRWLLGFADAPPDSPAYSQTLLVQPNLEILAYRQGLTPDLVARLTRFAAWKVLGSACTLQFQPETVYRALEAGETFDGILQTLERHGMKATPAPVIEALRTWAGKRERITVYGSAALFEFQSADDLSAALARGLPAVRLSERLAIVPDERRVDFRHFRLTGTRDYALPPERCVEVEADGVTLSVDLARSDLLLDTEVQRFAETVDRPGVNGRRLYRLTPASLATGKEGGVSLAAMESWFIQRTGQPLSPAARLLLTANQSPAPELKRLLVLNVATQELADGLQQWPGTRSLVEARLGPTALVVREENVPLLQVQLRMLGIEVRAGE
jgi:hypothetical protein